MTTGKREGKTPKFQWGVSSLEVYQRTFFFQRTEVFYFSFLNGRNLGHYKCVHDTVVCLRSGPPPPAPQPCRYEWDVSSRPKKKKSPPFSSNESVGSFSGLGAKEERGEAGSPAGKRRFAATTVDGIGELLFLGSVAKWRGGYGI